ncbi:hypothetical protein LCGC14_2684410 [marine sediment metagenome]|uniref:Uncharacterized protein n=1 Tax=marine sediment metagenome TaxID=412755 RepID=A0A0F8ZKC0_9ZZZZ
MEELRKGKVKKIKVTEKGLSITMETEVRMSHDFLRMRHRVLGEAMESIKEEMRKIGEIAKTAKIKLD